MAAAHAMDIAVASIVAASPAKYDNNNYNDKHNNVNCTAAGATTITTTTTTTATEYCNCDGPSEGNNLWRQCVCALPPRHWPLP